MSKKRRYQPVSASQSKKRARSSGSRQKRFSSSEVAMWFGTTSTIVAEPGVARRLAERAQLALAAEIARRCASGR